MDEKARTKYERPSVFTLETFWEEAERMGIDKVLKGKKVIVISSGSENSSIAKFLITKIKTTSDLLISANDQSLEGSSQVYINQVEDADVVILIPNPYADSEDKASSIAYGIAQHEYISRKHHHSTFMGAEKMIILTKGDQGVNKTFSGIAGGAHTIQTPESFTFALQKVIHKAQDL